MPLTNGDVLFRYVPPCQTSKHEWAGVVGVSSGHIQEKQKKLLDNVVGNYNKASQERLKKGVTTEAALDLVKLGKHLADCAEKIKLQLPRVGHVGIYEKSKDGDGVVWEVGAKGFNHKPITGRPHYDIVIRFKPKKLTDNITKYCNKATKTKYNYPHKDLVDIQKNPLRPDAFWRDYNKSDKESMIKTYDKQYNTNGGACMFQSAVICSHAVHAILYASIYVNGTLATATNIILNYEFRISPVQLILFIQQKIGIFRNVESEIAGIQHKGTLINSYEKVTLGQILTLEDEIRGYFKNKLSAQRKKEFSQYF